MALIICRINKLMLCFFVCGMLLVIRLAYLQLSEGHNLAVQSLAGRAEEISIGIARGEISDCNGLSLTNTAQQRSIIIFPSQIMNIDQTVQFLTDVTGEKRETLLLLLKQNKKPFRLISGANLVVAERINNESIPGVIAVTENVRYGDKSLAAHVTGYTNIADNRGVSGIEGMYDEVLRGSQAQYAAVLVDASQRIIPGLGYKKLQIDSDSGPSNVILTLDTRIQKITETTMDRHMSKGAVVVMRPSTGEILAMASRPNFDANRMSDYLTKESAPLMNRAIAAYQPGSVFKLVVAAAALEQGFVHSSDVFYDAGYIDVNDLRFKGWDYNRGARGYLTFTDAMAYSSNPVFIEVGLRLGAERLIDFAQRLGFGRHTKLNFDGEADGNLPEADSVYPGDLANLAIGQGSFEATPLQIATLVSTIVNDGIKVDPYIVSKLTKADGTVVNSFRISRGERVLSRKTAIELRTMMAAVTNYGTGRAAYVEKYGSAGKTGSAETGRLNSDGHGINHAWFAGYVPFDNPQYVIVVLVEEGMSGGDIAAPIFREIATKILSDYD